jgi:hypothetical protein
MRPFTTHLLLFGIWLLASPVASGFAQERPGRTEAWACEVRTDVRAFELLPRPCAARHVLEQNATPRDPLKNGALIGAIIGAVTSFGFVMYLCHALREEGDPPCLLPSLAVAGAGAGAGALIGVGIDALQSRHPVIRFSVRF